MKGYFSQLAHITGLNYQSGRSTDRRGSASQPAPAIPQNVGPAPIHVESVVFTEPTTAVAPNEPADLAIPTASLPIPIAAPHAASQNLSPMVNERAVASVETVSSDLPSRIDKQITTEDLGVSTEQIQVQYVSESTHTIDDRVLPQSRRRTNERLDVVSDSHERDSDQPELSQRIEPERISEPQQTQPLTVTPIEVAAERLTLQDYLDEVRRWLVAKPEDSTNEAANERQLEIEDMQVELPLTQKPNPSWTGPSDSSHELEQNDLSLSIGSINIVIEQPASAVAASPPIASPIPSDTHDTERRPTSLSRYYLRSW